MEYDLRFPNDDADLQYSSVDRSVHYSWCYSRAVEAKGDWACVGKGRLLVSRPAVGYESNIGRKCRKRETYSIRIREDTWERMSEITPRRYEHATRRRRETRVADDLEER